MSALCLAFLTIIALLSEINGLPTTSPTRNSSTTTAVNRSTRSLLSGDDNLVITEVQNQCCHYSDTCCEGILANHAKEVKAKNCIKKNDKQQDLKSKEKCPIPSKILKKTQGRELYCSVLNIIDKEIVTDVIPKLAATNSCIAYDGSNKEIREPAHFVNTVRAWLDSMRETHTTENCCFQAHNITQEEEEEFVSKWIFTIDETITDPEERARAKAQQKVDCTKQWSEALYHLSLYMNTVEMLESLGRRKSCLRGCVGEEGVKCAKHYLFGTQSS
ncbi:PREDICTED: uncharacterized protein LOC109581268 [Amphimedon queenslandica]|uniref:Secreted protein n=1 Tax=Amphimedon queenslandica TaxID=400682 RepID=A0A1X7V492_AMPQE|nr:PREDICTED: uncharacterized protein LOC109581268 [Amphimedon queenslandica]|eukprot:XP_019850800.1 PREDICTED: uncharacterized protein LOC109581268 [Amphimedon queenslandica]